MITVSDGRVGFSIFRVASFSEEQCLRLFPSLFHIPSTCYYLPTFHLEVGLFLNSAYVHRPRAASVVPWTQMPYHYG